MPWTLTAGTTTQTIAAWGIAGPRLTLRNQAADLLQFTLPVDDPAADPPIADESAVVLTDPSGVVRFRGTVTRITAVRSGTSGELAYTCSGPWNDLEELIYHLPWPGLSNAYLTRFLMPVDSLGNHKTAAWALNEFLVWAIAQGAPIQIGNLFTDATEAFSPPITELRDRSVGEVIRDLLRWCPRAVVWFDYTTSPATLHIRNLDVLTERTVSLLGRRDWSMTRRRDMEFSGVALTYEIHGDFAGNDYIDLRTDDYPVGTPRTGSSIYAQTVDLRGGVVALIQATVETEPHAADTAAWWLARDPILGTLENLEGPDNVESDAAYAAELLTSPMPDWVDYDVAQATFSADFTYTAADGSTATRRVSWTCLVTNAPSGTYSRQTLTDPGDPLPIGLAEWLYNQLSAPKYEGQITLIEDDPTAWTLGCRLNFSDGRTEWASARAAVQVITLDLVTGTTTLQFGPPSHLAPQDVVELLR